MKTLLEIIPLAIFFLAFKFYNLEVATVCILVTTLFTTFIIYRMEKRVSVAQIVTLVILVIFGGITIISGDSRFIKMKPTILYIIFATTLLWGAYIKKQGILKFLFDGKINLSDSDWTLFTKRWGYFFLFLAVLNESIWRNFSETFWVNFKVFGLFGLTAVFLLSQMSFLTKSGQQKKTERVVSPAKKQ
jgi:intracellular septation protein